MQILNICYKISLNFIVSFHYMLIGCSSVDQPDVADWVFAGLAGPVS